MEWLPVLCFWLVSPLMTVSALLLRAAPSTQQCRNSPDPVYGGRTLDCSDLGLLQPPAPGHLVENTTSLLLDRNNMTRLSNFTFSFTELRFLGLLNLSSCSISVIEAAAFHGLALLDVLDLQHNMLTLCSSSRPLPIGLFQPLPKLSTLLLAYNMEHKNSLISACGGPSSNFSSHIDIFWSLPLLTNLSIDVVNDPLLLDQEFSQLTHLTSFTLACRFVSTITNSSLRALTGIRLRALRFVGFAQSVELRHEVILEPGMLAGQSHLTHLSLLDTHSGNKNMLRIFQPIAHSSLQSLHIVQSNYMATYGVPDGVMQDGIISQKDARYLLTMCVQHLTWTESFLFAFEPGTLTSDVWAKCVQSIDLSHNKMDNFGWITLILQGQRLKKLSQLTVSSFFSTTYDQSPALVHLSPLETSATLEHDTQTLHPKDYSNFDTHLSKWVMQPGSDAGSEFPYNGVITYYMYPDLSRIKIINMIFGPLTIGSWTVVCKSSANLRELYWINNNELTAHGVIYGLESLQLLDLTGSAFVISDHFLDTFSGLRALILRQIQPDTFFRQHSVQRLLRNLTELSYLDLTNNGLNHQLVPPTAFSNNPRLAHLILAHNRFSHIPFSLGSTPMLEVLDLSSNAILFLTQEEMVELDRHTKLLSHFMLRLNDNGIACVCSQIQFIAWMFQTPVHIEVEQPINCLREDGQNLNVSSVPEVFDYIRMCSGRVLLLAALVSCFFMCLVFLNTYLVFRFRTAIETFFVKLVTKAFRPITAGDYKYGVFIGYADGDYKFVKNVLNKFVENKLKMSTYIYQRDQLACGYMDQQFLEAITASWRVVLVLSSNFLHKYVMADIIMKYASHSVTSANPHRLLVLVESSVCYQIPGYLHQLLDEDSIILLQDFGQTQLDYQQRQKLRQRLKPA